LRRYARRRFGAGGVVEGSEEGGGDDMLEDGGEKWGLRESEEGFEGLL